MIKILINYKIEIKFTESIFRLFNRKADIIDYKASKY